MLVFINFPNIYQNRHFSYCNLWPAGHIQSMRHLFAYRDVKGKIMLMWILWRQAVRNNSFSKVQWWIYVVMIP